MRERVDEKHRMMKHKHPHKETKIKARKHIRHHSYQGNNDDVQIQSNEPVVFVLKTNPFTRPEVRNFRGIHHWSIKEKPTHMRKEKTSLDTVRVFHGISLCMVYAVIIGPCCSRTSKAETSEEEIQYLNHGMCLVCFMSEKSMIPCSDTYSCEYIEAHTDKQRGSTHCMSHEIHWCQYEEKPVVY